MSVERGKPRKAWIIITDEARNPHIAETIRPVELQQPLAVPPPTWSTQRFLPIIDGITQLIMNSPEDMVDYLKSNNAPYRAEVHGWGSK